MELDLKILNRTKLGKLTQYMYEAKPSNAYITDTHILLTFLSKNIQHTFIVHYHDPHRLWMKKRVVGFSVDDMRWGQRDEGLSHQIEHARVNEKILNVQAQVTRRQIRVRREGWWPHREAITEIPKTKIPKDSWREMTLIELALKARRTARRRQMHAVLKTKFVL